MWHVLRLHLTALLPPVVMLLLSFHVWTAAVLEVRAEIEPCWEK